MTEEFKQVGGMKRTGIKMPVLFIGHGSPMNGIEENDYTRGWRKAVEPLPKPKAIIVVSAHWETYGTKITANKTPPVIYDFGGFPRALYEAEYNVAGSTALAKKITERFRQNLIAADESWGLDHGAWTILRHLYPAADIPVLQLSLNRLQSPAQHYEPARELAFLRERGVLIVGSGNMVHNLRYIVFARNDAHSWAAEANEEFKKLILSDESGKLTDIYSLGSAVKLSVPTLEHFLPLLYTLALKEDGEPVEIFNDAIDLGSISMTSVKVG